MGKIIDITDKLSFEEKPSILIKGKKIEVNDDAANIIKVMAIVEDEDPSPAILGTLAEMIFTEKGYKTLSSLHLNMDDFTLVVETAMNLITGDDDPGEAGSDTTTSS